MDLLCIDIYGNDYHVFDAIDCVKPRVVVIECDAKVAPPILYCMDDDQSNMWHEDDCSGASLKFLEISLARNGHVPRAFLC